MLSWWSGTGGQEHRHDDTFIPETPAPVFAARAFRSALFGTPHPDENPSTRPHSLPITIPKKNAHEIMSQPNESFESPSKKQGILLTPGTIGRRKTVSFGVGVVDNEGKRALHGKSGIPNDCPGKFPSPYTPKVAELPGPSRRTSLTKAMENSREKTKPSRALLGTIPRLDAQTTPVKKAATVELQIMDEEDITDSREESDIAQVISNSSNLPDYEGDMTFDLNKPHSQSGRYWKSEYERYHQEAFEEMKKLVKYRELAKSFAKKKDDEAMSLSQKLKEEQCKVVMMEDKVARLSAHIANRRLNSIEDQDAPDLMRQLARQQALTEQYRAEVNSFQQAMENQNRDDSINGDHRRTMYKLQRELKKAREQLKDMNSLRSELHGMKLDLSAAERKITKTSQENMRLRSDLAQVKEDLDKSRSHSEGAEEPVRLPAGLRKEAKGLLKSLTDGEVIGAKGDDKDEVVRRKTSGTLRRERLPAAEASQVQLHTEKAIKLPSEKASTNLIGHSIESTDEKQRRSHRRRAHQASAKEQKPEVPAKDEKPNRTERDSSDEHDVEQVVSAVRDISTRPSRATEARTARTALLEQGNNIVSKAKSKPAFNGLRHKPIFEMNENIPRNDGNKAYDFKRTLAKHTSDAFNVGLSIPQQAHSQIRVAAPSRQRRLSNAIVPRGAASRVATPRKALLPERAEAARKRLEQRNALKQRALEVAETSGLYMSTMR